jgi:hypothetical protein
MPARRRRLYSLFSVESRGKRKRYERLSDIALPLSAARAFWQSSLLRVGLNGRVRELRPVSR